MDLGQTRDLLPWLAPLIRLTYVSNTGAVFGLFPGQSDLFMVVAIVVAILILIYYRHLPSEQMGLRVVLGLQMGGALGNLIDRIVRGSVVDFLDFNFWPLQNWAIFNLADASIVSGVVLLAMIMLAEQWSPGHSTINEAEQET